MVFEQIESETNAHFATVASTIKQLAGDTALDIAIKITQPMDDRAMIHVEVFRETDAGQFELLLKGADMVACDIFRNATEQPMVKQVLATLKQFTNLPVQCPFPVVGGPSVSNRKSE